MSDPGNVTPHIWELTNKVCEGTISEQEVIELDSLLKADRNALEFYVDFLKINSELLWLVSVQPRGTKNEDAQASSVCFDASLKRSPILGFVSDWVGYLNQYSPLSYVLLLILFGNVLLATMYLIHDRNPGEASAESVFVAMLTATKDCQWSDTATQPTETIQLQVGRRLQLEKGLAQITYFNGAEVLLEGPVSYTVDSHKSGVLSRGKLFARADKKDSRHFTIFTPDAKFEDLGTEFGVEVDAQGRSAVVVFSGKVNASSKLAAGGWSKAIPVTRGEAVVCVGTKFTPLVAQRSDFPSMQPLPPPPPKSINYLRWLETSGKLQSHQDLVAYYDFQPDRKNTNVLLNRAPTGTAFNGVIQKATWTQGRFPEKTALEFMEPDSGVRVNLPGEYRQMTVIAWVQSDRLANSLNGILMSDDWDQDNKLHLQIKNTGQIIMDVYGQSFKKLKGQVDHSSIKAIPADSRNDWCMIAGVIDSPNQCSLYVNGEFFETLESTRIPPVRIGSALIGGWNRGTNQVPENQIRNFSGRIDELMIFKSILTAEEIKQIYESGKPENH